MKKLDPRIVKALAKKIGKKETTVKKDIYLRASSYPSATKNAVAQIYAREAGHTVFKFLDGHDRASMPAISMVKSVVAAPLEKARRPRRERIIEFLRTSSTEFYKVDHITEINRAYTYRCLTACFVLCRKVVENLVIDVLRARFHPGKGSNLDIYFDARQGRYRDFGVLLKNLKDRGREFGPDAQLVERVVTLALPFKKEANDKAHSWFHIVRARTELDALNVQDILSLLEKLLGSVQAQSP